MRNFTKLLLAGGLALLGSQAAQAQQLLDNYENTRLVSYPSPQGTITVVANPGANGTNSSSMCASYVRDGSQYATVSIQLSNSATFADVTPYINGTKKISLKVRTTTGAGTAIQLVLQNRAKAIVSPYVYPQGNYMGVFNATTAAAANTWETLTFTFAAAQSDASVTATTIDQIAMLVAPNSTGTGTYYLDDLTGPEVASGTTTPTTPTTPTAVTDQLFDNHEGTRVIKYKRNLTGGGFRVDTLNNNKSTGNQSNNVMRYSRGTGQYDGLFMGTVGAPMSDVTPFVTGAKQMTMKVYSPAVGTKYQITLQDSTSAHTGAYPTGRHSEYLATSSVANAWETLVFTYANHPDANLAPTGLNELVLLINAGTTQGVKVYLDDFYGPHLTNYLSARQASTVANLSSPYPNPATDGLARLPFALKQGATVSLTVFDALGRRVAQPIEAKTYPAGEHAADISTARLTPGIYTCRLLVDGAVLTSALSVQ